MSTKFVLTPANASTHKTASRTLAGIVLWLTPADGSRPVPANPPPTSGFRLVQKDKMFDPHLLVVPTGSNVEFPNLDPFFHNVFSLFNGKRFDLGLYEAGTRHSVRFDREGVSYIFCNIHPEMGAIVLALSTPLYAISTPGGMLTIHGVPPGRYRVHMWSEQFQPAAANALDVVVQVTAQGATLEPIALTAAPDPLTHHTNKFGEPYTPPLPPAY